MSGVKGITSLLRSDVVSRAVPEGVMVSSSQPTPPSEPDGEGPQPLLVSSRMGKDSDPCSWQEQAPVPLGHTFPSSASLPLPSDAEAAAAP